jgi:hypothetical protein
VAYRSARRVNQE